MIKFTYVGGSIKKYSYWLLGLCACLLVVSMANDAEECLTRPDYEDIVGKKE